MSVTHTVYTARQLDAALIRRISAGDDLVIGDDLARRTGAASAAAQAALAAGPVYGVSTGMGALSGVPLSPAEQRDHQRRLLAGRAAGGPPWLPEADVRALLAVRLATFLSGDAGVSPGLCARLAEFLRRRIVPAVPATAAGTAGEIIQLAHAFGPVAGIGDVLAGPGRTEPAAAALARAGLGPLELGPKEGIALLAGVPGATALSLLAGAEAGLVAQMMTAAAGLSAAAIGAPPDPWRAACARGDDVLAAVLARLRAAAGQEVVPGETARPGGTGPRMLQAPVSFRVAGAALAAVARAAGNLEEAAGRALAGVTDSPAFLDGQFTGTAGFHGIDLALGCAHLAAAVSHAAEVSAARLHRLMDPRVTGLPAQLAARPGPEAGLVAVHKRVAGEVHALRRLAGSPAAAATIETSGGQEDVQSFAWAAAAALRESLVRARTVAAGETLAAWQAARLSGRAAGPGPAALMTAVAGLVAPVEADRPLGPDIERLAAGGWLARLPWRADDQ